MSLIGAWLRHVTHFKFQTPLHDITSFDSILRLIYWQYYSRAKNCYMLMGECIPLIPPSVSASGHNEYTLIAVLQEIYLFICLLIYYLFKTGNELLNPKVTDMP